MDVKKVAFYIFLIDTSLILIAGKKWSGVLPPGYQMIDGEAVDVTNKLVQVTTPSGTAYYSFDDLEGKPIYTRDASESGWHFVAFDDPYNQDPGGGHLIVLQRMTGISLDGSGKIVYEAFLMALDCLIEIELGRDSVAAEVDKYDPQEADYYEDEDRENANEDMDYIKEEARSNGVRPPKFENRQKRSQRQENYLQIQTESRSKCEIIPFS